MKRAVLYISIGMLSVFVIVGCGAFVWYMFFEEASFELADDSRLPRWFAIPQGHTRADVSVTMSDYYVLCGGCSIFILHDRNGKILQAAYGKDYPALSNKPPKEFYPSYILNTVNGITEVIEHRKMEPKFYISDNPAVLRELLGSQPIPP
jgi:hypothetical protein